MNRMACVLVRGLRVVTCLFLASLAAGISPLAHADSASGYRLQPGDLLHVSVWREEDLKRDVLVRPDGGISLPMAGDLMAAGRTVDELRVEIERHLRRYIPEASVAVAIAETRGNVMYVIGKVARPGEFQLMRDVDVMQALSMAGGMTTFAKLDEILILRRENGDQKALRFNYEEASRGEGLERNILLRSGDVVVVP